MSGFDITGVEEIVTTQHRVAVEIDGVEMTFLTGAKIYTTGVNSRGFTLADIEPAITHRISSADQRIKGTKEQQKLNVNFTRGGEIAVAGVVAGNYVVSEIQNDHNLPVESGLGLTALLMIAAGEMYLRKEKRKTDSKLEALGYDRFRLSMLHRAARSKQDPSAL